ncbi:trypsin-like peptidase domain-containing protein [Candidatus Saccharibacteria bacterium]|nr:trypsin-like peptidase domain-containing protein [Candidatus Saccharibacteria bacterium]
MAKTTSSKKSTKTSTTKAKNTKSKNTKDTKNKPEKATKAKKTKEVKASATKKVTEKPEEKPKKQGASSATILVLGLALIMSGVSLGFSIYNYSRNNGSIWNFNNATQFVEGSIADVANRVSESVVSIVTENHSTNWYGQDSTSSAAGTGIIVSEDGYILTNKHVADGARNFKIIMNNGTSYTDVKLVGTDPLNDIAFLKINDVSGLKTATLGDSKTLSVGQQVITIGNALGQYQNSVASGIISGTGRTLVASNGSGYGSYERLSDMIQTDAAINSGNSGGPLVNAAGEVVGVNTATSAYGDNIGFAIPISSIKGMLKSIIEKGKAERAYIGVAYLPVTAEIKESYNLDVDYGAYLADDSSIIAGGPAEKAGLKTGDVILAVSGINIGKAGSLSTLVGEYPTGATIEIKYRRDGQDFTANITLEPYQTTTQRS